MHKHDRDKLEGPIRGSSAWWRGLAAPDNAKESDRVSHEGDPNIRWDLVKRVRAEIAQGLYDTPEKWDETLDRLLDRLA